MGATLFPLDAIVVWREIRKYVVMSHEFCPGLSSARYKT